MVNVDEDSSKKKREEIDDLLAKLLADRGSTEDSKKTEPQANQAIDENSGGPTKGTEMSSLPPSHEMNEDTIQTILRDIRFEVADLKVWIRARLHRFEFLVLFLVMFVAIYVTTLTSGISIWLGFATVWVYNANGFLLGFWEWLWISFIAAILALINTIAIALFLRYSRVRQYLGELVDWLMEEKPGK